MPCKIEIRENLKEDVRKASEPGLGMSIKLAQDLAKDINTTYGYEVVEFILGDGDFIDRYITIPDKLVDSYYDNEKRIEERGARPEQIEDAKRAGEEYTDEYMFQLEEISTSTASESTLNKVKEAAKKMGIDIQKLTDYVKAHPEINTKGANAVADLLRGIIAVSEGKENVALTEEMVHIATAILEQTNPSLITEMISKIGRFKIYNQTLEAYRNNSNYKTPDGKPDIRKIKKEAVDKLIAELIINQNDGTTDFPELMEETNRSWVRNLWNSILDRIRGMYRKSNISIFEEVAKKVGEGEIEGNVENITAEGVYLQISDKQKEVQEKIMNTQATVIKRTVEEEKVDPILLDTEEASNWYEIQKPDGTFERVKRRVTDRVKAWYRKRFPGKVFTAEEKLFNEKKRELGIIGHSYFQEIHGRYFNPDGTRKTSVTPRSIKLSARDEAIYNKLEKYFVDLVDRFSKDGKTPLVFSEVIVYDKKEKEAGTIDLLILDENGKANIFDWKFMSTAKGARDVAWYKQGAYNLQLGRYKEILISNYGIKEMGMNRAIPILMNLEKENAAKKDSPMILKGIVVGSADTSTIEDLRLVPVSEETETTGHENLDELIRQLNAVYRQIGKKTATSDEEREFKSKRLNLIKEAIRMAQGTENIAPLINVIKEMRVQGEKIMNDWKMIYKDKPAGSSDFNNKQLSDFAEDMREYVAMSTVFGNVHDLIGDLVYNPEMEAEASTEEQREEVSTRKDVWEHIQRETSLIRKSSRDIKKASEQFADKFIGIRNLVTGLLSPEAVIRGLSATFRGVSELPAASLRVLFKMVENAKSIAAQTALGEVNELLEIRKKLAERGGDLRKLVQQVYQKDDKGGLVNKLIHKYRKEFYQGVTDNALEGQQNKQWLYDNIDVKAYREEAEKHMNENIEYLKLKYSDNPELAEQLITEERQMWDITRSDFRGWNNYIIKRHPSDKWMSDEYNELKKDEDLLSLYNFISRMNKKAVEAGYLQNKGASTFLPFIRKSMAEGIAWDFSLSTISNWSKSFNVRADDVGYGAINELTGELEYSIPKYYTQDFTKTETGENDYSDVSEDLFKNIILYVNHMEKYKHLSDIEGQLQLVKTIEEFKGHLNTSRMGELILEDGKPKVFEENRENAKLFDDFLRALLYEQKYPLSSGDIPLEIGKLTNFVKQAVNNVMGSEVFKVDEKPTLTSVVKVMDAANRWYQVKTLGLEAISGAVNIFGGNIQVATQAGNYFKAPEFFANEAKLIGNKFKHDDEREMFVQLVDKFMPVKDDPTYNKLKEAGMTAFTRHNFIDMLMVFMRDPEQHLEKSIFLTLLQNMMVEDGHIVSIREYVKNKHKDRYSSPETYREAKTEIENEIEELKKTRSIDKIKKLEDGKLVIPGLDLNNTKELQRLTDLTRRISRNATGALSNSDLNRMGMNIWTKSMMIFKNWIPKLVDTRFSEFRRVSDDFSVVVDDEGHTTGEKYDIGRIRLLMYVWGTSIRDKTSNIYNILSLNEKGIESLDRMYEEFAEKHRLRTGQEMSMTREDFIDMIRNNLSNQVKELAMLLALGAMSLSMGFVAPDDDDDRATKNFFRWSQRVLDKFKTEISFFYNPAEFQRMLGGSAFPAIGVFKDIEKFATHFTMQVTGYDISNPKLTIDEVREKAQPIKYAAKMLPFTKSLITYGAIIDSDFAKEFDITVQRESNRQ